MAGILKEMNETQVFSLHHFLGDPIFIETQVLGKQQKIYFLHGLEEQFHYSTTVVWLNAFYLYGGLQYSFEKSSCSCNDHAYQNGKMSQVLLINWKYRQEDVTMFIKNFKKKNQYINHISKGSQKKARVSY